MEPHAAADDPQSVDSPAFAEFEQRQEGKLQRRRQKQGWSCSSGWHAEFFVVSAEYLVSFSSTASRQVNICICLNSVIDVLPCPSRREPCIFSVRYTRLPGTAPCGQSFELLLRAGDAVEMQRWVDAIKTAREHRRCSQFFVPICTAREQVAEAKSHSVHLLARAQASEERAAELQERNTELEEGSSALAEKNSQELQELQELHQESSERAERSSQELRELHQELKQTREALEAHCKAVSEPPAGEEQTKDDHEQKALERQQIAAAVTLAAKLSSLQRASSLRAVSTWRLQASISLAACEIEEEKLAGKRVAAAAALAAQLCGLRRASRAHALGAWRLETSGCRGRSACIAAGAARGDWACRQSSRRTLRESFARLRPPAAAETRLQEQPAMSEPVLENFAAVQRSLAVHRLRTSFYLWRLRTAIPSPDLERWRNVETQTDQLECSDTAAQVEVDLSKNDAAASCPTCSDALIQTEGLDVEWLDELAKASSPSSGSEASAVSQLALEGRASPPPDLSGHTAVADTSASLRQSAIGEAADLVADTSASLRESAVGEAADQVADTSASLRESAIGEAADPVSGLSSRSSANSSSCSSDDAKGSCQAQAAPGMPLKKDARSCVGKLNFDQLEKKFDKQVSALSSARSRQSSRNGHASLGISDASSRSSSSESSSSTSPERSACTPAPADNSALSLREVELQRTTAARKERESNDVQEQRKDPDSNADGDEYGERWWRNLADVVVLGSGTESNMSDTLQPPDDAADAVASESTPPHAGTKSQHINGGTGSSYDDGHDSSCSSGGSSEVSVDVATTDAVAHASTSGNNSSGAVASAASNRKGSTSPSSGVKMQKKSTGGLHHLPSFPVLSHGGTGGAGSPAPSLAQFQPDFVCRTPTSPCPAKPVGYPSGTASLQLARSASRTPPTTPSSMRGDKSLSSRPLPTSTARSLSQSPLTTLPPPPGVKWPRT